MHTAALALVIASGLLHAVWNLLLKQARDRIAFVWWFLLVPLVLFSPMAFVGSGGTQGAMAARSIVCGLVSGVLQAATLLAMTRADGCFIMPRGVGSFDAGQVVTFVPIGSSVQ